MAEKKKYNSILVSGRKDETLTYSRYVKDEESGESVKESLDKKVNNTDELETQQIKDGAITNEKMAADSVGNTNLQDGSVSNEKLEDGSITNDKLAENSITKDKLQDKTIGVEKLDPELRQAINAATGLPDDLVETIQNVDDTLKDHQSQLDDKQSQIDDKQQQITANDEDISLLQTRSTQMEETIKGIAATGGASQATAVTYDNEKSGLTAVNAQAAIDETNTKLSDLADNTEIRNEDGETIKTPFREIVSSEFLHCIVDTEDHFLFGIQLDGSIEWGKGIPAPIRAKLQEIINQCQQDKTDILEAINTAKEELSSSITALQEGKVDKEEGKSLIEDEVKECFRIIENEEFLKAIVDSDDKVLFGFYRATGMPYYPLNEMYHVIQNEEYFAAWVTTDNKVVLGIRRDGEIIGKIHAVNALKQVISQLQEDLTSLQEKVGTIDTNLKELLDVFSLQENPEYLAVEKDTDGRVLSATNPDGSHYIHNAKSETIPTEFEHIEDPEGRTEITTDTEGKVLGYRDSEGKKHENDMQVTNLDVSNINLKGNSVNNIQDALKANGFDVKTPIDWSDSSFIQIPEPRFAIINVSNIDSMPTTKTDNKKSFLEFWDMQGNYFKKHAILNAQGRSSMSFPKKNVAIDFCDDEWIGDNTPKIRIGNWVPQDSFHLKANYTDFFRGVGCVAYKLYEDVVKTRGNMNDRPWKKALLDMSKISTTTKSIGNPYVGDYSLLTDTGARCFPDGFPVAIYLNGEFYGVFSLQLKKHRDNFHMNKSTAEHVHLDGIINIDSFWGDSIDWSQFEVRNPKNLYAIGGNKYDADIKQEEIAGKDEVNTWIAAEQLPDGTVISSKIKKNLQMTAKVKEYILNFSNFLKDIKNAENVYKSSNKTEEDLKIFKSVFERYWDADNVIDYLIVSDLINNWDGVWGNNWQLFTYDGKKWWIGLYDVDGSFGNDYTGTYCHSALLSHVSISKNMPFGYVTDYYLNELNIRYRNLSDTGIINSKNIFNRLYDWTLRIGTDFFNEEYKKWSDSPCIADSVVRSEYWEVITDEKGNPQTETSETYNAAQAYNIGDEISFGLNSSMGYFKYRCIKATTALTSNTPHKISAYSPISEFKHCDNIYRAQKWIEQNTANMDKVYNYTRSV